VTLDGTILPVVDKTVLMVICYDLSSWRLF